MVPQIWSATDTIFCHFGLFFAFLPPLTTQKIQILKKMKKLPADIIILHRCNINDNHIMYGSWENECNKQHFFVILDHFLQFYPPNNPKNQNFEKLKKRTPGDIIMLHKCTKNHDHMLYCSLDMVHNRFNCYFSFWAIFYPFTSLKAQKIKF